MSDPQRDDDLRQLRAFVRGELSDDARRLLEARLDEEPQLQQLLGVVAREQERGRTRSERAPQYRPQPQSDPHIGLRLGDRYQLRSVLGRGGMGTVYEAEHLLLGRTVAIKVLHPEYADRPDVRRRFENEARASAALDHPHIVRALDVGRSLDGSPFVVFEHLVGEDLETHLRKGRLSLARALTLSSQIADGLAEAHRNGIVHRDLKPANVFLVGPEGVPKILDFGISKMLREATATQSGAFMGTPAYMAPEQLRDARNVDARADIYALGMTLYRMIMDELPHQGLGLGALLSAREEAAPSPRSQRPDVPLALDAVIRCALAPARDDRYATMDEFRRALLDCARDVAEDTTPPRRADELRVVTALVGAEIDLARLDARSHGRLLQRDPCVVVFGESSWTTNLLDTAIHLAATVLQPKSLVVVGTGRVASGAAELQGGLLEVFHRAQHADLRGTFVTEDLRSLLETENASLDGLYPVRARAARAPSGVLLGRDAELAQLEASLARSVEDHEPNLVTLEGPPGIGKSRLLERAARLARSRGMRVLRTRGRSLEDTATGELGILATLIEDIDTSDASLFHDGSHLRYLRLLQDELDADDATRLDVGLVADRVRLAVVTLLETLSTTQPVALLLEDAQWMPSPLWHLMERVLDGDHPLWIVAASRAPIPLETPARTTIRLRGLRRRDVRSLAESVGDRSVPDDELAKLVELTEGNPFFIDQVVRAAKRDEALPFPPSVEAAIQARLDSLPEAPRELIKRASIFENESFRELDLRGLGDVPKGALGHLRQQELLRRTGDIYRVASTSVARTAYRMLTPEAQQNLHLRAARHLAAQGAPPERVAGHFARAQKNDEASDWFARAALRASSRGDIAQVIAAGRRAREGGVERVELCDRLAEAFELEGRFADESEVLRAALDQAKDDERAIFRARLGVSILRQGDLDEALRLLAQAEREAEGAESEVKARVLGKYAALLVYAGDLSGAAARLDQVERLVLVHAPQLRAEAAAWRGQLAAATGDLADRRNAYWAAVELYRERGDLRRHAGASVNLADVYNRLGAYDEAARALEAALEDCRAIGFWHGAGYAWLNLAYAKLHQSRLDEAKRCLDEVRRLQSRFVDPRLELLTRLYQARLDIRMGKPSDIESLAAELEDAAMTALAALAWSLVAEHALQEGQNALPSSARAMELLASLGSIEEDGASIPQVRARALRAAGKPDEADAVQLEARAELLAASRRIRDPLWRERFLTDVAVHRELLQS